MAMYGVFRGTGHVVSSNGMDTGFIIQSMWWSTVSPGTVLVICRYLDVLAIFTAASWRNDVWSIGDCLAVDPKNGSSSASLSDVLYDLKLKKMMNRVKDEKNFKLNGFQFKGLSMSPKSSFFRNFRFFCIPFSPTYPSNFLKDARKVRMCIF